MVAPASAVLAVDDPCLVGVDPQAHLPHSRGDRGQHILGLPPALAVHDDVVGETLERAARKLPGHPRIERVVQEQVRQDRRDRRSLRGSLISLHKRAVRALQRSFQPPLDVQKHPAAVGDRVHRTNHEVPRDGVEELLDVEIDHPVVLPTPLPAYPDRVMSRLLRAIAIGVRVEPRLHQRLQKHGHRRLRDPVGDRRHAEHPGPRAVRLRDLHRPDRGRKEGPRTHPIPDLVQIVPKVGLELLQALPVHSRRTLVGLDLPPRLPDQQLGNRKRLLFGLWHVHPRFLPEPHGPG